MIDVTPALVVVGVTVSAVLVFGFSALVLWACGVDFNEKEFYDED